MKAALIPPIPTLHTFGHGDFHLLLSHLLSDQRYLNHYIDQRKKGAYLVLDNSAHEFQAGQAADLLREQAVLLNAQEVVVPDVLEDYEATVEGATCALETWFEQGDEWMRQLNPALMYVPQGRDQGDWLRCLMALTSMHEFVSMRRDIRSDFVIGISKDYEVWEGGIAALLEIVQPFVQKKRAKVHLLGWGRNLWELGNLARQYPWIRSTDSAKPFVYALDGITLDPIMSRPPDYPRRPENYFSRYFQPNRKKIAERNVEVFRGLARGEL